LNPTSDPYRDSLSKISRTQNYLETGNSINWVVHTLEDAIYRAVEAWLLEHDITVTHRGGWQGFTEAFKQHAAPELYLQVSKVLSGLPMLAYELECDAVSEPTLSLEAWRQKAKQYVAECRSVVTDLQS